MSDYPSTNSHREAEDRASTLKWQKWGGVAFFLLWPAFVAASLIYLTGDLRATLGPYAYSLADFLYGPVWAASLVTAIFGLRERMGKLAPRRMNLALLAAVLAAGAMVTVAFIRSANRQYHILHPELRLENSTTVLVVWSTLVSAVTAAGWHFLGWVFILTGWAGWANRQLPRLLSGLLVAAGIVSLFVYQFPNTEGFAGLLGILVSFWQGTILLRSDFDDEQEADRD